MYSEGIPISESMTGSGGILTLMVEDQGVGFEMDKIEEQGEKYGFKDMGKHIPAVCGVNPKGSDEYLKKNFPSLDIAAFKCEVRNYVEKNIVVKFRKGAPELLDFLKQNNIKVALATGTTRKSTEHHLNEVGLNDYFDATVCGDEIENGKPAPDIFLKAAKLLKVQPETCFVFEDSLNGIKAGFGANMKCIGVPDIVTFTDDDRKMMFCEIESLDKAIPIFEKILVSKSDSSLNVMEIKDEN